MDHAMDDGVEFAERRPAIAQLVQHDTDRGREVRPGRELPTRLTDDEPRLFATQVLDVQLERAHAGRSVDDRALDRRAAAIQREDVHRPAIP